MLHSDPILDAILAPLAKHYASTDVIEARMSQPQRVTIERRGSDKAYVIDESLTIGKLEHINMCLSNKFGLSFDVETNPNVSCVLPNGHRYECLIGTSVQSGLSLAIRCKHPFNATYRDYGLDEKTAHLIEQAVIQGKQIIVSGTTNTGKTTFLNLLLKSLCDETRLVVLEDTPEIDFARFPDSVGLISSRSSGNGSSMMPWSDLYDHSNRITPDRLIFSEISTQNAESALALMNSGAGGFMCTIHANSSRQVIDRRFQQILSLADKSMIALDTLLAENVDMIIQLHRSHGARVISEIFLPKENRYMFGGDT